MIPGDVDQVHFLRKRKCLDRFLDCTRQLTRELVMVEQRLLRALPRIDQEPALAGVILPAVEHRIGFTNPARNDVCAEHHAAHVCGTELVEQHPVRFRRVGMRRENLCLRNWRGNEQSCC